MTHADARFEVQSWEEEPYDEIEGGPRLTRARVTKTFHGDLEGTSTVHYLMIHRPDGTANFVGHERVTGRLGARSGSFVLEHSGTFAGGTARATWTVVAGSGTGELAGLEGHGGFESAHATQYPITFEYRYADR